MRQDPASSTSDVYELKIAMFENSKPEEFLKMMKNIKKEVNGTGSTDAAREKN